MRSHRIDFVPLGRGRRGILGTRSLSRHLNLFVQRWQAGYRVKLNGDDRLISSGSEFASFVNRHLYPVGRIRQLDIAVDGHALRMVWALTATGSLVRHTLGFTSPWIPAGQLARALNESSIRAKVVTDLDSGVRLSITDQTDRWRESIDKDSVVVDKWRAVLSDTDLLEGLPIEVVQDELERRIRSADLPSHTLPHAR